MASQVRAEAGAAAGEAGPGGAGVAGSHTAQRRGGNSGGAVVGGGQQGGQDRMDHYSPPAGSSLSVSACRVSSLVNWRRPFRTSVLLAATNTVFWCVALCSLRAYSLLATTCAVLVLVLTVKDLALSRPTGARLWHSVTGSWEVTDSGQDSRLATGQQFSDSFKLLLQETSSFKQQNPGKFCLLVCSLCTFFAVLGRYIPGVIISYILVLGIFLWPLMSTQEFGLWLKPVLQKLDFGIGEFLQKIRDNHERRLSLSQAEKESIEADLSSMFPKLDSTVCKEMSVSDTEVSDVTWTDNGTFNLSEGHTPQTENSEDLDREEVFTGGLPEFPSLDNGMGTNGDDDDDLSLGLPTPSPPQQGARGERTSFTLDGDPADVAMALVNQMAGDAITAAVTAAIQERIEAAVAATVGAAPRTAMDLADESDSEVEDFELLDQSELEQLEGELGLGGAENTQKATEQEGAKSSKSSSGFFSKLLGRH